MKILFLHSLAEPELGGGADVIVWEQMRGLRDLRDVGHEYVLLATSDTDPITQNLKYDNAI